MIEKLTPDAKMKDVLMKPVRATRDHSVSSASENFFHFVVFDLPRDLTRHLIEKSTRKGAHKKIADLVSREMSMDQDYKNGLRTSGYQRQATVS